MSSVKELPKIERPRERLRYQGISNLSTEDLLTILIGSGGRRISSKEISIKILSLVENVNELSNLTYERLNTIKGLGPAKICIILSAIELARRIKTTDISKVKITNSKLIYEHFKEKLEMEKQEYFYAVYLDASKKIISSKLLFKGTLDYSLVHPREIFKEAYLLSAQAIICVHNHPSGNITPSIEDKNLTKKLVEIGDIHGIHIIDHVIIGRNSYYSFFENGDLA